MCSLRAETIRSLDTRLQALRVQGVNNMTRVEQVDVAMDMRRAIRTLSWKRDSGLRADCEALRREVCKPLGHEHRRPTFLARLQTSVSEAVARMD